MSDVPRDPAPSPADPARCFGGVVDAYQRGRPGYPREAVRWLTGPEPLTVLELGAGTGKLTEQLVALGHDVHATEPDPKMLDRLAQTVSVTRLSQTSAEDIPAADASYDLVIAGQSYHWFDKERALPEIARVLKRGGSLALVWNVRDERIPWVKRLGRLIGNQDVTASGADEALEESIYFGPVDEATYKHWQTVDRVSIQDLVRSRSNVATLSPEQRDAKIAEVLEFYDDYGRGMDGMQLPYLTRCYRAVVGVRPKPKVDPAAAPATPDEDPARDTNIREDGAVRDGYVGEDTLPVTVESSEPGSPAAARVPGIADPPTDDDSGMLLIDFR